MIKCLRLAPLLLFAILSSVAAIQLGCTSASSPQNVRALAADAQTQAVVTATTNFLDSLNPEQRGKALFPFAPESTPTAAEFRGGQNGKGIFVGEKYGDAVWSNFPTSDVPRPGVTLGSLNDVQRAVALKVLRTILSADGYQKVIDIMDSDQQLSESSTPYDDGNAFYTLGIFGTPSGEQPWMLQFGGHHLAINVVVAGSNVAFTPSLTGSQPAAYTRDGQEVRPLGRENDKAFKLINALNAEQRQKATLTYQINDLVLGPGQAGRTLPPEGLSASEMTPEQQAMLLDLINEWVGMLNQDDAAPKLAQIRSEINQSYFAWSSETTNPSAVYFRITGPALHIEFAHQGGRSGPGVQAGGVNHIHTIYRDPTNDYGKKFTGK